MMETALSRTATWPPRWSVRVGGHVVWIWVLTITLVLYMGLNGGGYDSVVRSDVGVIVWWVILAGAILGVLPVGRMTRGAWAALALFGGFAAWTALAVTWSLSPERSLEECSRVACYLGVLVLAVTTYGDRRQALRHSVGAVASASLLIVVIALLSRLRPGLFPSAQTTASFLPGTHPRLSWPLNYWNALGAMVALSLPLMLALATTARALIAQAAAAAAIPAMALCGYLTFSRGSAIAGAVALLAFFALTPDRLPKLATGLVCAGGSAALIAGAVHRHAIEQGFVTPAARHEGATLMVAVVLVCAGVAFAQVGIGLAARHGTLPRWLRVSPPRARALLAGVLAVVVILAVLAGAPGRLSHAWNSFKRPSTALLRQDSISRFGQVSGNGRYTYWKTAVNAMPGHWLGGFGPGTFQLVWLPRAPVRSYVLNAHSLYVETLTEVGIVGLALLAAFLSLLLGTAIRRVFASRHETRTQAAGIAAACVAFLVSAAFDWVWQVPVLPIALVLLSAALLAPERGVRTGPAPRRGSLVRRAGLAVVALAALVAIGVPLAATVAMRHSQSAALAGNTTAALVAARSAARLEPGSATAHLQEALVWELQGRLDSAVSAARQATTDEPQNWQTWYLLSRLEREANQPQLAAVAYRRARALNPRSTLFRAHATVSRKRSAVTHR